MLAEVGSLLVGLALAVALYAAFAAFWGIRQSDSRWAQSARNGVYATTGLLGLAFLVLLFAFLNNQFQIRYVSEHSNRALPLYWKISALWAGQEGSLLLWTFLQALFTALAMSRPSDRMRPLVPWATVFLNLITAFFTGVTLFLSNPFFQLTTPPLDGQGLNPLLRHFGMVFHPPALYLGYVGLAVPFAFALAALVTRQADEWPAAVRRWTLAAWLFLGLGLFLGARWAYDVLGWGGYWAWDPVENAGLLPWFTATALLHSTVMQEQKRGFRGWNLLLAVFSFALVLFGTYATRSGAIQSVHAFARSNLGPYFLAAIGLTLTGSLILAINRRDVLTSPHTLDSLLSRDGMFFLTLFLFLVLTASVFVGSVLPTITEGLTGQRFEASPAWFDRVTGPQFAVLALVMGICPLLGQAAAALQRLRTRGWPALIGAVLVTIAAYLAGFTQTVSLIGFAIAGLAGATTLTEYVRGAVARSQRLEENLLQALVALFERNRRKYGGYLVHVGVLLMVLGIIGTRMYSVEEEVVLTRGEPATVGAYTLLFDTNLQYEMVLSSGERVTESEYTQLQGRAAIDQVATQAPISVYRDQVYLTTLHPQMDQYEGFDQTVAIPALWTGLREDLYLILAGWGGNGATATVKVYINPLANFLWLGGLVFMAGGAIASLGPPVQTERVSAPFARRRSLGTIVGLATGILLLAVAGWTMWWPPGHGVAARSAGRPLPGQPAPDFSLDMLDGSTLALSELRGQVSVINFWATWCQSCEDEMPDLQAVWEEYQDQGVTFVGIAYQDEAAAVRGMISDFGVTYPPGLDVDGDIYTVYGSTGVPETFVIDAQGNMGYFHIGTVTAEQLRAELDSLLGK